MEFIKTFQDGDDLIQVIAHNGRPTYITRYEEGKVGKPVELNSLPFLVQTAIESWLIEETQEMRDGTLSQFSRKAPDSLSQVPQKTVAQEAPAKGSV